MLSIESNTNISYLLKMKWWKKYISKTKMWKLIEKNSFLPCWLLQILQQCNILHLLSPSLLPGKQNLLQSNKCVWWATYSAWHVLWKFSVDKPDLQFQRSFLCFLLHHFCWKWISATWAIFWASALEQHRRWMRTNHDSTRSALYLEV